MSVLITTEHIQSVVLLIGGAKVILDADLAALYGMPVKRLNEQVLSRKLDEMEKHYDLNFRVVLDAIRKLMEPPPVKTRPKIGFELKGSER